MEYWVEHHWHDFAVYSDLEESLYSFINDLKQYEEYTLRFEEFEKKIEVQVNIRIYSKLIITLKIK